MEDIPQPSPNPYEPGDNVRVYLDLDDPDSRLHGVTCVVVDRFADDFDKTRPGVTRTGSRTA